MEGHTLTGLSDTTEGSFQEFFPDFLFSEQRIGQDLHKDVSKLDKTSQGSEVLRLLKLEK